MSRSKATDYSQLTTPYKRTEEETRQIAAATRLRTLVDMTEREIRALERFYGCPIIRPERTSRTGRATRRRPVSRRVAAAA